MTDLNELKADKVIDSRGSACPGPILEAKKGIGGVAVGGVIEVLAGDEKTVKDLPMWAKKMKHEYLGHLEADGYFRIFVRRMK